MTNLSVTNLNMTRQTHPQLSDTLVMVRPVDFGFNEQTGADNEFQHRPAADEDVTAKALMEFDLMVTKLRAAGLNILVLEKADSTAKTPDAVFPNNWFSTTAEGTLLVYPMFAENRRQERHIEDLTQLLNQHGYLAQQTQIVGDFQATSEVLEGTGVLVIDHIHQRLFAAQSERCHPHAFADFAAMRGYQPNYLFQTASRHGAPIYHSNVMMSLGQGFAVICAECFTDQAEYAAVKQALAIDREVIEISLAQMEQHFCGNILQVQSQAGEPLIVMSQSAYQGFTLAQRQQLESHGRLLVNAIPTIEKIGGGSARCMLAEVFLPKSN